MLHFLLRPRWLAWHAALVVVLVAFTMLGMWQLDSFEHHGRPTSAQAAAAPVPLESLTRPGGRLTDSDVFRRVTVRGSYDPARQLLVPREDAGRTGFLVVSPLRTSSGVVPVVRGWVPTATAPGGKPPAGEVTVSGRLLASEPRSAAQVDPLAALPRGQVAYVDTLALLEAWPYRSAEVFDGYVVRSAESPRPAVAPTRVAAAPPSGGVSRWRNLAYALQWWLFAGAAVFFWAAVIRRAAVERRTERSDTAPPVPV